MLVKIPLLSFLAFGVLYPLCFWLSAKDPIKNNFHRFHLACPFVIGGLAVIMLWALPQTPPSIKYYAAFWLLAFGAVTAFYWNKETVAPLAITLIVLWGIKLFANAYMYLVSLSILEIGIALLSGLVVVSIFYAMNLGHFYLNVHGLKIHHLKNAVIAYAILLGVRLAWNIFYIPTGQVMHMGEETSLWHFMLSIDGFFLWVALFFGTIFPLGASYFAFGTLKLKNTQATTGILYVLLSAVLLGDLAYKYYLLKYSIAM